MEGITLPEGLHDGEEQAMPHFQVYPGIYLTCEENYSKC